MRHERKERDGGLRERILRKEYSLRKRGAKAGEVKLTAALLPGEYRTAVATVPDPRSSAEATMQARASSRQPSRISLAFTFHLSS